MFNLDFKMDLKCASDWVCAIDRDKSFPKMRLITSVLKTCHISELYFDDPEWKNLRRFTKRTSIDNVEYHNHVGLVKASRYESNFGYVHELFSSKTNKTASPKMLGSYCRFSDRALKTFFEPTTLLCIFSVKKHNWNYDSHQIHPFTLKKARKFDFGSQVSLVKYLPKNAKHIVHICAGTFAVLNSLTGHHTLIGKGQISSTICVQEKPNRLKNCTGLLLVNRYSKSLTEYKFQNKKLRRSKAKKIIGKTSRRA